MNYADIKYCDVANGKGVRVSLFVSGCTHRCKGCFNEIAWNFDYGEAFTRETEDRVIGYLNKSYIAGLSLLGGEPFERANQQGLLPLLRRVKAELPGKDIWCYSGYDFEKDILGKMCKDWPESREMLSYIDILVDGKFVEELKSPSLQFKGSANQRIIDVKASLKEGKVVLWQDQDYAPVEIRKN